MLSGLYGLRGVGIGWGSSIAMIINKTVSKNGKELPRLEGG